MERDRGDYQCITLVGSGISAPIERASGTGKGAIEEILHNIYIRHQTGFLMWNPGCGTLYYDFGVVCL